MTKYGERMFVVFGSTKWEKSLINASKLLTKMYLLKDKQDQSEELVKGELAQVA